jgi:hypothetical protein
VYRAQHNETLYAVKVLTGMDELVTPAAALSLSDPLLHKFEQVRKAAVAGCGCSRGGWRSHLAAHCCCQVTC